MTNISANNSPRMTQKGRILLVEDERTNMLMLSTYLEEAGYLVDQALNGQEALEKLQSNPAYTLVVTDRLMPVMDGMTLSKRMRGDANLQSIPIIMQTGATEPQEIRDGIKTGVYYYLTKPFQEETLLALVNSAIRDSQQNTAFSQRMAEQQEALNTFLKGRFQLQTPKEAEDVAFLLSRLFARPEQAVTGLYELILNAVEHGNLTIGLETKAKLLEQGQWQEEINRRLALPENRKKNVVVTFAKEEQKIIVTIADQGQGFDWRPYLEIEPSRATQGNGRGIAKAVMLCFDSVAFQDKGNQVQITGKAAAN